MPTYMILFWCDLAVATYHLLRKRSAPGREYPTLIFLANPLRKLDPYTSVSALLEERTGAYPSGRSGRIIILASFIFYS